MTLRNMSPYNSGPAYAALVKEETDNLLPLLLATDAEDRLREALKRNDLLRYNGEATRKRVLTEIRRRFNQMPVSFWEDYQQMTPGDQHVALFLVLLKSYRILFDFQTKVILARWARLERRLTFHDLRLAFMEMAREDSWLNSWADSTRKRLLSGCLSIYRQVGLLNSEGLLCPLQCSNFGYYLTHGEPWYLEACLLQDYEIQTIKTHTFHDHRRIRTTVE